MLLRALDRTIEVGIGVIALALIATAFGQVVARYVFGQAFGWALEVDVLLMVWLTMLSGYLGVRRRSHMATDFIVARFGPGVQRAVAVLVQLLCAALVTIVGLNSFAIIDAMQGMRFVSIDIEQTALYWSLPIGMGLMLLAIGVEFARRLRRMVR